MDTHETSSGAVARIFDAISSLDQENLVRVRDRIDVELRLRLVRTTREVRRRNRGKTAREVAGDVARSIREVRRAGPRR